MSTAALLVWASGPSAGADNYVYSDPAKTPIQQPNYSPYAGRNFPTKLLFGDTHLHTKLSLDARAAGLTLSADDAYRFARGEEVKSTHGLRAKMGQPLDFLVVADHSDAMGAMNELVEGNPALLKDARLRDWYQRIAKGGDTQIQAVIELIDAFTRGDIPEVMTEQSFARSIWAKVADVAEKYNEPGRFSAIIGYEWTSGTDGNNLHRNVLYRDGAEIAKRMLPFTVAESDNPEKLWEWMAGFEQKTGGSVLAIAHNGNLSNGIMFPVETNPATGAPLNADYASARARWEPIYEYSQIKGDGEAHPKLSPDDEFADYETWDRGNLGPIPKEPDMLQYEYAREAQKNGLKLEAELGTNPYKFGASAATDSHTGLATAEEDNFFGKIVTTSPNPKRMSSDIAHFEKIRWPGWWQAASGYTAVWATRNTRADIFDAMQRKETYGTSGPRIAVRFFGGWDFNSEDANSRLPANVGYAKGVPMGGDLTKGPDGKMPTFLVAARKDPMSGNLDRVQIVKGWLDKDGNTHEKVHDVVWSGDRQPGTDGKLPAVGNTVDVANATWTNTIGTPELITVWTDPDFDPQQRAFYYARVIEIPTPRWTAYEAKYFKVEAPKESPMITQERAYTSSIWYTP